MDGVLGSGCEPLDARQHSQLPLTSRDPVEAYKTLGASLRLSTECVVSQVNKSLTDRRYNTN